MKEYTVKVYDDGTKEWYLNGKLHREDGPAIEWANDDKSWYLNDKLHREDGPAFEYNGAKEWWLNGKLHREDGPAVEYAIDGHKFWYLNGVEYSEEEFIKKTTKVTELTLDEIAKKFGISVDRLKIKK